MITNPGGNDLNGMALCAGVGGLELGLRLALSEYRCVCYVEREAYAARVLVSRMEDQTLDQAPIWDDIETFDGKPWRGIVDVISAGFPCQPWSDAGKRHGLEDDRWLWEDIARIISEVRPCHVFLENVPGLARGGLSAVLGSLSVLGFDAEWGIFSAAASGAPHVRKRLFILAHANGNGPIIFSRSIQGTDEQTRGESERGISERCGEVLAHSDGVGCEGRQVSEGSGGQEWNEPPISSDGRQVVANPDGEGLLRAWLHGGGEEKFPSSEPGRDEVPGWWEIEPPLGRVVDGVADRVDQVRAIGNGVVPAVAATAFTILKRRLDNAEQQ